MEEDVTSPHPVMVTLAPAGTVRKTPFDHLRARTNTAPSPNPYRFIQRKLGMTEAEFEVRTDQDVEELLQEIAAEKTQRAETPPRPEDIARPISKEECLRLLRGKE